MQTARIKKKKKKSLNLNIYFPAQNCFVINAQELSLKDIPDDADQHSMTEHTFHLPEDTVCT